MAGTVRDRNIGWLRKRVFYPVWTFQDKTITTSVPVSQESATSTMTVITGTKFTGGQVTTANDGFDWIGEIPYDIDPTKPVGFTVLWTKDTTGGTHVISATWAVAYSGFATGVALATGATALTTPITAQTVGAADSLLLYRTPRGILSAADFATNIGTTAWVWALRTRLTAFTASGADKMWMLGLEVDYIPRKTFGWSTGAQDASILTNPFGAYVSP